MARVASYTIVYNPVAGRGRAARIASVVRDELIRRNQSCTLIATEKRGQAESIARDLISSNSSGGPVCVAACGGDGTIQDVANALANVPPDRAVMAVIPAGRCNDFARALGLPKLPTELAGVLIDGVARPTDLGRVGQRYFCTIAAMGFDAAVSRFVNDMRMPLKGPAAYVYGTLNMLLRYRTPTLRLTGDFGQHEGPVFLAATANTPWYGGAMHIAPPANPFDGKLDVCLVGPTTKFRVLGMLSRVMRGRHVELPEVSMLRTTRLNAELISGQDVEIWADGEPISQLPATIECVPGAVTIMLPRERPVDKSPVNP